MPLKHLTETALIALLAVATMITGLLVATLPLLPQGLVPGFLLLITVLLYPLILYPTLKHNRADYAFRLLHFAPATLVLLWFLIQFLALAFPWLLWLHRVYTWGWTLPAVLAAFLLLGWFVLSVIRRRFPRLIILGALLLLFLATGLIGEVHDRMREQLAASLWRNAWRHVAWGGAGNEASRSSAASSASSASSVMSDPRRRPPRLSHSGPASELFVPLFLAGYCGVLHRRARRRV
ncbi:MAG: hypothetical protein Greene041619_1164 [Candidatus Peregrinibacteria bacterium Greene0416_19]|nr:MAG: hypothetical protein Greene041619_1164 [Candidatus Peregrinibacteria bacterium Greene0416_19]